MNIDKVVIAYDGSEESEKTYDMGLDLCLKYLAEMIVIGHRGGGGFLQRWRLGSIARRVQNYAQCTVVIVR